VVNIIFDPAYNKYVSLLRNIQTYFQASSTIIHQARNTLKIIIFEDKSFAVKSFKRPCFLCKIIYTFFRASKAKRSFKYSQRLLANGIAAPNPVGYVEKKRFGLLDESYYISEEMLYDFTIREAQNRQVDDVETIYRQFVFFAYTMHQKGIIHLDFSPGNILIKREADKYKFAIVDVNRMQFKPVGFKEGLKNFSRLWLTDEDAEFLGAEYAKLVGKQDQKDYAAGLLHDLNRKFKAKKILKNKIRGR